MSLPHTPAPAAGRSLGHAALIAFLALWLPATVSPHELRGAFFEPEVNVSRSGTASSLAEVGPRSLLLDPAGGAYLLWIERIVYRQTVAREITLSHYRPRHGWDSLSTPVAWWDGRDSLDPSCAVDWAGRALHLTWIDVRDGPRAVYGQVFVSKEGLLSKPFRLSEGDAPVADQRLVIGPDNQAHVVWMEISSGRTTLRLRHRDREWGEIETPVSEVAFAPDLAVDSRGHLHMVWSRPDATGTGIGYARRSPAGDWEASKEVDPVRPGRFASAPAVAAAPDGSVSVAWSVIEDGKSHIVLRRRDVSGVWQDSTVVAVGTAGGSPALAVDAWGVAHLVWEELRDEATAILYRAVPPPAPGSGTDEVDDRQPTTPRALSRPGNGPHRAPMIAVDASGRIAVAWIAAGVGDGDLLCRVGVCGFARPPTP